MHFPRTLGYSSAGIVEKTGAGVRSVKPGDRVALSWSVHSAYCTTAIRKSCRGYSNMTACLTEKLITAKF